MGCSGCSGCSSSPPVPGSDELSAGTGFLRSSRVDERHMCRAEHSCRVRPGLHLFTQHRPGQEGPLSPGKGQDAGQRCAFPHRPGTAGRVPAAGAATPEASSHPLLGPHFGVLEGSRSALWSGVRTGTCLRCPTSGCPFPERENQEGWRIRHATRAKLRLTSLHLWEPSPTPLSYGSGKHFLPPASSSAGIPAAPLSLPSPSFPLLQGLCVGIINHGYGAFVSEAPVARI